MKRIITILLTILLLLAVLSVTAFAEETEEQTTNIPRAPGFCGESISWTFDRQTGILDISGNGAMDDFPEGAPWLEYREDILEVRIWGNIDYIGAHAFEDFDALAAVYTGTALRELGKRAFYSCDGLTKLELPSTFRCFGEESLRNCTFLKEIHCMGGMPSFRLNCLWDTWAKIYFPVNNPWPLEHIQQLESAFQGRIEFLAEDGYDPYVPEDTAPQMPAEPATEATTEATTEVTEEATTLPSTAPTEPTGEATLPSTAPPTEPSAETTVPPATEPPVIWGTEPPTEPAQQESGGGSWIAIGLISGVLLGVLLGAVAFNRRPKGGRKSRGKGRYSR